MSIAGVIAAALRQEAPYAAEIQMGAQLILDFQGARTGGRPYYWYRGTRYTSPEKIPGWTFSRASAAIGEALSGALVPFAPGAPAITDRALWLWGAQTNKVAVFNANPDVATTGYNKAGDAASTLTRVLDVAELQAAGLYGVASSGYVMKLDNSAGVTSAYAAISGSVGNLNPHTASVYVRATGGTAQVYLKSTQTDIVSRAGAGYGRLVLPNTTPDQTANAMTIKALAGAVVYFILPQLEEGSIATSPIITTGSAATRAADGVNIAGLAAMLGGFRTNYVPNAGMAGAGVGVLPTGWSASSGNGVSTSVVATGTTPDGYPYVDIQVSGTPTSTVNHGIYPTLPNTIAASLGQGWNLAADMAVVAGVLPTTLRLSLWEADAGGAYLSEGLTNVSGSVMTRWNVPRTLVGASTAFVRAAVILPALPAGVPMDVTIRIAAPQMERGLVPTAPIITTAGAITVGNPVSVVVEEDGAAGGAFPTTFMLSDVAGTTTAGLFRNGPTGATFLNASGSPDRNFGGSGSGSRKIAARIRPQEARGAVNNALTSAFVNNGPSGLDRLTLGAKRDGSSPLNGGIKSLVIYGDLDNTRLAA